MQLTRNITPPSPRRKRSMFLGVFVCAAGVAVSLSACSPSSLAESPGQTAKETVLAEMQRKVDSLPGVHQVSETRSGSDWETFVCSEGEPCLYDNRTYTYTPLSATSAEETNLMVAGVLAGNFPEVSNSGEMNTCEDTEACLSKTVKTGEGNVNMTVFTVKDPHEKNSFRTTVNLNPASA